MSTKLAQQTDIAVDAPVQAAPKGAVAVADGQGAKDDIGILGHPQWVSIDIINHGPRSVKVKNVKALYGKFFLDARAGNKNREVPASTYENYVILPNGTITIASCGRKSSPSGTEGRFDLFDDSQNRIIREVYWDCPWGKDNNTWRIGGSLSGWKVADRGANEKDGALGNVNIELWYQE